MIFLGESIPAWFDIKSRDPSVALNLSEDEAGIKVASSAIHGIIQKEIDAGIPASRIVVGGFSQGAALAIYATLTNQHKIGGIISLSGFLPLRNSLPGASVLENRGIPALQVHGDADETAPLSTVGVLSNTLMKVFMTNLEFKVYNGLTHTISQEETLYVKEFLDKILNNTTKDLDKMSEKYEDVSYDRPMVCSSDTCPSSRTLSSKPNMITVLSPPNKASTDKKEYRSLKLNNGMRILLISDTTYDLEKLEQEENIEDEEEGSDEESGSESNSEEDEGNDGTSSKSTSGLKKSAAGLCVGMGSFSDPTDLPGLAHFLEHMVFMGSAKYPDENAFDEFIQKHGGFDNAHTECEHTTFYFEIQRKHFREALDRFAQFFKAPLMKKDAMQREREAIDSEFQMSLPSDSCRKEQIFGSLARPDHPMAKFMWGNLSSLQMAKLDDDDVHKRLHAFFCRHYTAQSMTLTVQSQETLDNLEKLVIELFSSIPNNNKNKETFHHLTDPFKNNQSKFSRLYKIAPIQNIFQVDINWALPPLLHEFKSKPIHYLSTIIGHEGKGSLISFLRKKVWALQLCAGNALDGFELNTTYSKFSISIILTQEGYENKEKVLVAVFSYLKMLKKCGPNSRIFEEIHKVDRLDFEFGQQPTAVENVEKLCESMQLYPPEFYLTGGDLIFEFDSKLVADITRRLNEEEANVVLTSKQYQDVAAKTEPWFKTKYIDEEIPKEWTEAWKNTQVFPEFHLPPPNIYIAENLSLLSKTSKKDEARNKYPTKIKHDDSGELFYRLDDIFEKPRAIAIFTLRSPLARQSVENAVCLDLLVSSLGQIMITDTYAADQALLEHTVNVGDRGEITIKINGLNDKLILLLKTILTYLSELSSNPELCSVFDAIRDQTKKNYYNFFIDSSKLVRDVRLSVLQDVHWTAMEKHQAVSGITIEMVKTFTKRFLQSSNIYVQGLVQGNVTEEEAISMHTLVLDALASHEKSCTPNVVTNIRCNEVPDGDNFLRFNGINPKDTNTIVTNYYQSALQSSLENHMMMEIALTLMAEPVFDILRTKEQLGYNVYSMLRNTYGILGISITVNSQATKFTADHVNERIESFLTWFVEEKLANLKDSEFDHFVATLIKAKKEADVSLSQEVDRNWAEVASGEYLFDRHEKTIQLLEKCEKNRMVDHVKSIIDPKQKRKKLSVQVLGNPDGIKIQTETNDDNGTKEDEAPQVSCDLDPDGAFDMKYLKSDDHTLSSKFIINRKSFKEGLKTYDVTHIIE